VRALLAAVARPGALLFALSVGALASGAATVSAAAITCRGEAIRTWGTDGNDHIVGTGRRDVIWAGAGDDVVYGMASNDLICGGPGNDVIHGGVGDDIILGNDGNDTLAGDEQKGRETT
jgi:Ca2+-binding RTX toxin-like protein